METIINFFNNPFFLIVCGLLTLWLIITSLYSAWFFIKGIWPVLYRLGIGLSKSNIAIFASAEYASLESMILNSKLFKAGNITQINSNDISKADGYSVFLVHWKDYQNKIDDILKIKKDDTALVVYAPQSEGRIEPIEKMELINSHRNTIVVNFRGRLMNDLLVSLITTGYSKK